MQDLINNDIIQIWKATNFLSLAQLYLKDNFSFDRKLNINDIKNVIKGHWGTLPGVNFIYASIYYLLLKYDVDIKIICGPGHAAAAIHANAFLEGSLERAYPIYSRDKKGIGEFIKDFGRSRILQTEASPFIPGVLHQGGELGGALSVAYGASIGNYQQFIFCIVGDGDSETGPTSATWKSTKYFNRQNSGKVIPILHLNGNRMFMPSIYSFYSKEDMKSYFRSQGYNVYYVDVFEDDLFKSLEEIIDKSLDTSKDNFHPLVILKSPKGWTGPKEVNKAKYEGSYKAHKPISDKSWIKDNIEILDGWFRSYTPELIFNKRGGINKKILNLMPTEEKCLFKNNNNIQKLNFPNFKKYQIEKNEMSKGVEILSHVLSEVAENNKENFKVFSPDELESNGFGKIAERMYRTFNNEYNSLVSKNGSVFEILSEHVCQGWLQGYTITGRTGIMISYEAFFPIIESMIIQYMKYLHQYRLSRFFKDLPSINYISTSLGWRNTYSHQHPNLANSLLGKGFDFVNVFLPPDTNSLIACTEFCLKTKNCVNVIISAKTVLNNYFTFEESKKYINNEFGIYPLSNSRNPDVVLCSVGDIPLRETIAAADILKLITPGIKIKHIGLMNISVLDKSYKNRLDNESFNNIFTNDKPVIFVYSGYPGTLKSLLFDFPNPGRFKVSGYSNKEIHTEEYSMLLLNKCSRFSIIYQIIGLIKSLKNVDDVLKKVTLIIERRELELLKKYEIDEEDFIKLKFEILNVNYENEY